MEFYDGSLYLFAGKNVNREQIIFMQDMCKYIVLPKLALGTWDALENKVQLYNTTRGGSCVHDGFIYSFFGFNIVEGLPTDIDSVARVNLSAIELGWETLTISGCEDLGNKRARNGFGYSYDEGSVYINGGLSGDQILNSIMRLDLNNSSPIVECTTEFLPESISPSRRVGASLVYVAGKFYLFGGKEKGVYLGDLYTLDLTTLLWTEIVSFGKIPSARCFHSSASEGKYMVIAGGIGINELLQSDYYMLETETLTWSLLTPKSFIRPPPVYSNCIAIRFPKIYAVGGVEDSHITNSVWEFDISTYTFKKLYDYKPNVDTGLFGHGCNIEKDLKGNLILSTYFGSASLVDTPFCAITRYDLSQKTVTPTITSFKKSKFPCRCHNSYHNINSDYLLVAGGERYQQEFFNDIWIINKNTTEAYELDPMLDSAYLSAFSFFNNTLYIFSGYNTNGLSVNFPSSDFTVEIELVDISHIIPGLTLSCGIGMRLVDGLCEFCLAGTFNSDSSGSVCRNCMAGYYSPEVGATSVYQCVPCPEGFYSTEESNDCNPCPKEKTCLIGATKENWLSESEVDHVHHWRHHKDQPELYEPPNVHMFKSILWLTIFGIIFLFTIIFALDWRVRIFMSYYDIYKNNHIEMVSTSDGELIKKPLTIVPSKVGGYFTFVTVLILLAICIDSVYEYAKTNIQEEILLVPIDSLIDKEDFDDNSLKVYLMFSSYRGKCDFSSIHLTHSSHVKVESKHIESTNPLCEIYYHMKTTHIVETGDYIRFYLNDTLSYTSDINIRLKTHSSIPGTNSIVSQHLEASKEKVFRGSDDSQFYFSFLPSYFKEIDTFDEFSRLGYVLSISNQPEKGSEVDPREIGTSSGLGIKINLMRIEVGITTYKSPQVELMDYMLKFMVDLPGTILMFSFFLWFYEFFYNLCKGRTSGRRRLAKSQIERERARRSGQGDGDGLISSAIND